MYQVGVLQRPDPMNDETFEDLEDAENAAIRASIDDDVWGIWNTEGDSLVAIAYQQSVYSE